MTAEKLREAGIETLAIVASKAERARFYLQFRPVQCPVGADPDLVTHRAYGLRQTELTPEIRRTVESVSADLLRGLKLQVSGSAHDAVDRLDGFEVTESENAESQQHQLKFTGQFLVDREGIVRCANIECAREGLAGITRFPTEEELLAAIRLLSR